MAKAIAKRIEAHNAGRDAELTAVKFGMTRLVIGFLKWMTK